MEPFRGGWVLPIGPRDGGQGRRVVSPVWWSSDESSYVVSGLDERMASDFFDLDEIGDKTTQEQPVQTKDFSCSKAHTARAEPDPMSFSNRLRRKPATVCLSERYLESGECSARESREAGAEEQQTIRPAVATQGTIEGTNHGVARGCQLSPDMNQHELVKISSGARRDSAQTVAAMLEASVRDDSDDSASQRNVHKANDGSSTSTENACTRSSIASEEATSPAWTGNVTGNFGFVQLFDAPNVSPQHAEFLNVHWNGVRYEPLQPPARAGLSTPRNPTDEQSNLGRLRDVMAKYDSKVEAHLKLKKRPRRQTMMRPEVASRQPPIEKDARLAKISNSRHWREPLSPREAPRYINTMRLRGEDIPAYLLRRGYDNDRARLFKQPSPLAAGRSEARPSRGNLELGQAQAVRFSKPGKASVVKVSPQKSKSFDLQSLGLVESDIMFSACAAAKSARQTNVRTDGTQLRGTRSSATDGIEKLEALLQGHRQFRIPRAVPATAEHTVRSHERSSGCFPTDTDRDVRFPQLVPQLVRRLTTNELATNEDSGHAPVRDSSRLDPSEAPPSDQRSIAHPRNDRWTTGRIQSPFLKHKAVRFSLQDIPSQSRIPNEDDSTLASLSKRLNNTTPPPGNSGCPSLISDDGLEPCDFPEAVADEHGRLPMLQRALETSAWKEEDASTAMDETSSEGSSTLVHVSLDGSELFSTADIEAIHDENIRADEIHAGVGTSSEGERGLGPRARGAMSRPISFPHSSGSHPQRPGGTSTRVRRPDELTLYPLCALLRWLLSTTDAPGTPGMWHESSEDVELFVAADEYEPRADNAERASMLRILGSLSRVAEMPPELDAEVWTFLRSLYPSFEP